MYLIDNKEALTLSELGKALLQFQTKDLPKLHNYKNQYDGNHKILYKKATDTGKPNNKIVTNFCLSIVDNYNSYLTGKPITYSSKQNISEILDILNYGDEVQLNSEYVRTALIYGVAYEICYVDQMGSQRFGLLSPEQVIPIYDTTLEQNLLYVVRFWREDILDAQNEKYIVEVYSDTDVKRYKSTPGFTSFTLIDQYPHYYKQVPVTVFKLNEEKKSIFDAVISLNDAFETIQSSEVDDWESFCDSYMVLTGAIADDDALKDMKEKRVLMLPDGASAEYLIKNVPDAQVQNMLENIKKQIHLISNSPDFTDEQFQAQSGTAIQYKLVGFTNACSNIFSQLKKALQKRIELFCEILNVTNGESTWRDISIEFHPNLPEDMTNTVNMVNSLRGLCSDETLLSQIPFVKNVDEEIERVKAQKQENMEMYNFQTSLEEGEDE